MKTIPFKPAQPVSAEHVISWPMKRLTIDVPIDLHIRLKTGCAMRGEKIADVVRTLIEREFPPQSLCPPVGKHDGIVAGCRTIHAAPENRVPTSRPFDGAF
jgi:ParG